LVPILKINYPLLNIIARNKTWKSLYSIYFTAQNPKSAMVLFKILDQSDKIQKIVENISVNLVYKKLPKPHTVILISNYGGVVRQQIYLPLLKNILTFLGLLYD